MKRRFTGENLEEALLKASQTLEISVAELRYRTLQYPRKGVLGLFRREAIIEVEVPEPPPKPAPVSQPESPQPAPQPAPRSTSEPTPSISTPPLSATHPTVEPTPQPVKPQPTPIVGPVEEPEELLGEILEQVGRLLEVSCFDISIKECRFLEDGRLYIRLDGPDNSLLIGREGYRYNSLNLLLYTWLFQKYRIKLKLEIGDFLENQTQMVRKLIQETVEQVKREGYGKTPPLKGFLPYIAQELLRQEFPNMYVKVKGREGEKFVVIRPFYGHNSSNRNP